MPSGAAFLTDPDADESAPSSSPPVALAATATGLKYADLVVGEGETPVAGAIIKCNYTGTFADGRVFDSSLSFGRRPLGFPVGKGVVIKGWDLAILGNDEIPPMKKGGKRRIEVPPQLGYGSRGAGGTIPPNTTLFFDIELLP
jgi:peptidylprolyl isomerase